MSYQEFPELTPEVKAALKAGCRAVQNTISQPEIRERCYLAAFLMEAITQAMDENALFRLNKLYAIAENLRNPSAALPTLVQAQAEAANLDTPRGRDVVRRFLASLGEGGEL